MNIFESNECCRQVSTVYWGEEIRKGKLTGEERVARKIFGVYASIEFSRFFLAALLCIS